MLSKKWLFSVLLFGTLGTHAMEQEQKKKPKIKYFLEYKGPHEKKQKPIEISEAVLNQSEKLKNWVEEFEDDEHFYDKDKYEFTIPLDTIFAEATMPDGTLLTTVLTLDDIQAFRILSEKVVEKTKAKKAQRKTPTKTIVTMIPDLSDKQLIKQINLANFLNNSDVLNLCAKALVEKITPDQLRKFLEGKGLVPTIIKNIPDDVLKYVLKKDLVEGKILLPQLRVLPTGDNRISLAQDGTTIALFDKANRIIQIWNPQGKLLQKITAPKEVYGITLSTDGTKLALNSPYKIQILNTKGQFLKELTISIAFFRLAWSKDSLALWSGETIQILNIQGKLLQKFTVPESIYHLALSPDGTKIASLKQMKTLTVPGKTIRIWDTQGKLLKEFTGHTKRFYSIAFSSDGKKIASTSLNEIQIWNTQGKLLQKFTVDIGHIERLAWSKDSLTSWDGKNTIRIWKLDLLDKLPSLAQAALVLGLQAWHKAKKQPFPIEKHPNAYYIFLGLPVNVALPIVDYGWIETPSQLLKKIEKHKKKLKKKKREAWE